MSAVATQLPPEAVVPVNACIVRGDARPEHAPYHVLRSETDPFCGAKVGGQMEPYTGKESLCRNCVRVVRARAPLGGFFTDAL